MHDEQIPLSPRQVERACHSIGVRATELIEKLHENTQGKIKGHKERGTPITLDGWKELRKLARNGLRLSNFPIITRGDYYLSYFRQLLENVNKEIERMQEKK